MPYISGEVVPEILTRGATNGDSGFPLLADDLLENFQTACQIVSIHYQRREKTDRVLTGGEGEKTFAPPATDDLVSGLHYVEPPDEAGPADRPHFARAPRDSIELLAEPRPVLTDRLEQSRVREALDNVSGNGSDQRSAAESRSMISWPDRRCDFLG